MRAELKTLESDILNPDPLSEYPLCKFLISYKIRSRYIDWTNIRLN